MKKFLTYIALFFGLYVFAQENNGPVNLFDKEEELASALNELRNAATDAEREMKNTIFIEKLKTILPLEGVMNHPFSQLTSMSTIAAPDGAFRIFNWNVENDSQVHKHYCYVVVPTRSGKPNQVIELIEDRFTIPRHPYTTLTPEHWYGALYYEIVPVRKGTKTLYTIFGYSGNDRSTNQKLLDVFYFKNDRLRIGYPLFQESEGSKRLVRRVFFEYSNSAFMSLKMNESMNKIVFDHLSPESPSMEGFKDYYVPDMTYDAYYWTGKFWQYQSDVIAYNKENKRIKQYKPGSVSVSEENDTTEAEFIDVKDRWINPVDKNSPVENGRDATAPVEEYDAKKGETKTKKQKQRHKRPRRRHRIFGKKKGKPRSAIGND